MFWNFWNACKFSKCTEISKICQNFWIALTSFWNASFKSILGNNEDQKLFFWRRFWGLKNGNPLYHKTDVEIFRALKFRKYSISTKRFMNCSLFKPNWISSSEKYDFWLTLFLPGTLKMYQGFLMWTENFWDASWIFEMLSRDKFWLLYLTQTFCFGFEIF